MQNDEQDAQTVSRHLKSCLLHCNMLDLFKRACFPKLEHEKKKNEEYLIDSFYDESTLT